MRRLVALLWVLGLGLALELPSLPLPPLPPLPIPGPQPPTAPEPPKPPAGGGGQGGEGQGLLRFYGQITLSDGRTPLVEGLPLKGDSPWLPLLAPGMAVEAEGSLAQGAFLVRSLRILSPARFAYYRGPGAGVGQGGYPGVEVWTVEEGGRVRVFALRAAPAGLEVRLVVYWDGARYLALPPGLRPPAPGLPPGFVEALGVYQGGRVVWTRLRPFP